VEGTTVYTPGPNDPGYVNGFAVTYYINSTVPEPSSLALLALGLLPAGLLPAGLLAARKRRA